MQTLDPRLQVDLAALADELDAEALRNSAGCELFTNPAKALVERMSRRRVVLAGDCAATLALARHGSGVMLRTAHEVVAATGLADALIAMRAGAGSGFANPTDALFHDEEIDGPITERLRVLALTMDAERTVVAARVTGLDWRQASRLGALMNTRGLMELIVLNIGLDLHVISPMLFTMMVLMALITTIATTPVLNALGGARMEFGRTRIAEERVPHIGTERRDAGESAFNIAELYRPN